MRTQSSITISRAIGLAGFALALSTTSHGAPVTGSELSIGSSQTLNPSANWNTIAGGLSNTNYSTGESAVSGGFYNWIENGYGQVVGGGRNNLIRPGTGTTKDYNVIGGGQYNFLLDISDVGAGTIPASERVPSNMTIAGGGANEISASIASTIAGGNQNVIQTWANYSTISGGSVNSIGFGSGYSAISGGTDNRIDGGAWWGAINGGQYNLIYGRLSRVWTGSVVSGNLVDGNLYHVSGNATDYIVYNGASIYADNGTTHTGIFFVYPGVNTFTTGSGSPTVQKRIQRYTDNVASGDIEYGRTYRVVSGSVTYNSTGYSAGQTFVGVAGQTTFSGGVVQNYDDLRHWGWIGGGLQNTISSNGIAGSIGGGYENLVAGAYGTVPGGYESEANGTCSFAAGQQAKANHSGSFVWGDNQAANVASPAANTFVVRASGGIWLGTSSSPSITASHFIDTSTGAYLTSGGTWSNSSDRAKKENFQAISPKSVLEKVIALPVSTWNYKEEGDGVRHIGPMAQDFYKAFAVGMDDKHIGTVDSDGVSLAAIQGLNEIVQEKEAKIKVLEERLGRIERLLRKE